MSLEKENFSISLSEWFNIGSKLEIQGHLGVNDNIINILAEAVKISLDFNTHDNQIVFTYLSDGVVQDVQQLKIEFLQLHYNYYVHLIISRKDHGFKIKLNGQNIGVFKYNLERNSFKQICVHKGIQINKICLHKCSNPILKNSETLLHNIINTNKPETHSQNYLVRNIEAKDHEAVLELAQMTRIWKREDFDTWLTQQIKSHSRNHYILEEFENGGFQIKAVLYSTTLNSIEDVPKRVLEAKIQCDPKAEIVHVVDIHTVANENQQKFREILMKHLIQIAEETQEKILFISYITRSLPLKNGFLAEDYLKQLLENNDREVFQLNEVVCEAKKIIPACPGYVRLIKTYATNNMSKKMNKRMVFNWIEEIVREILQDTEFVASEETSLMALGIDSLEMMMFARNLSSKMGDSVGLTTILRYPTVGELIENILDCNQKVDKQKLAVTKHEGHQKLPLSLTQEIMWIWHELYPEVSADNVPRVEHLYGTISIEALEKSIRFVAQRHQILRTHYGIENGKPYQMVIPMDNYKIPLEILDLRQNENKHLEVEKVIKNAINSPMDLRQGQIMRILLIQLEENEHVLVITTHHIAMDGMSIPLFWDELVTAYDDYLNGNPPNLIPLKCQYFDWGVWQRKNVNVGRWKRQLAFWKSKLSGDLPILDLPTDFSRPEHPSYECEKIDFFIPEETVNRLKEICTRVEATIFMGIVSIWSVFLCRHSKQDEIVIGTPWANREINEIHDLIGCFMNLLPLRIDLKEHTNFLALLQHVKRITLEAVENSSLPFHKTIETLQLPTHSNRTPVFQTMIAMEEQDGWSRGKTFYNTYRVDDKNKISGSRNTNKFELSLAIREKSNCLEGEITYSTELFSYETARRLSERLMLFFEEIVKNEGTPYNIVEIVPFDEKMLLLNGMYKELELPENPTVLDLIEEQFMRNSKSIAISCQRREITYEELWMEADNLSQFLVEQGLKHGNHVGLMFDRTPDLLISLLAIMKIGAVYVPIDPNYPEERLRFMAQDAGVQAILTHNECITQTRILSANVINIDDDFKHIPKKARTIQLPIKKPLQTDLIYILYTSGTTGKPKGVKISHLNVLNNIWFIINMQVPKEDFHKTLFSTNLCFDHSMEEIFCPLVTGGTIILEDSPLNLSWRKKDITFMGTTPSVMTYILKNDFPRTLKSLVLGGEALSTKLVNEIFEKTNVERIYNSYGPSECTDQVTVKCITREDRRVNLGRPIANTKAYVLDGNGNCVPIGVWGELYIGGNGVGQGYLNRDELTKEKFIGNPFENGIIYKTGDIARWNADFELEFYGRSDDQVKINGVRIEKKEIEEALLTFNGIQSAHVAIRRDTNGQEHLVAYVIPQNVDLEQVEKHCKKFLPTHMVPDKIIPIEKLPIKIGNGKIDDKALPDPYTQENNTKNEMPEKSENSVVSKIISIYKNLLHTDEIDGNTNFFTAGGHSLLAVQLIGQVQEMFDIKIKMREFYENNTPRAIAEMARHQNGSFSDIQNFIEKTTTTNFKISHNSDENNTIKKIIEVYKEILQTNEINAETSFFSAGGHSLLAVQLIGQLQERFDIRMKMREFYENSTPKAISEIINSKSHEDPIQEITNIDLTYEERQLSSTSIVSTQILIIGAGVAGIMTAIECQKRNLSFKIVEKSHDFGGIWLHGCNEKSKLQTTSHVYSVDPNVSHSSQYPYKAEVLSYLKKVVELHGIENETIFNIIVEEVHKDQEEFIVKIKNLKTGHFESMKCDSILVCTGKHHVPFTPEWPKIGEKCPEVVHASKIDAVDLKDKNVVVVGCGSYAVEALRISHQSQAKSIKLMARRSHWIMPSFADTVLYSGIDKTTLQITPTYLQLTKQLESWLDDYYTQHNIAHMIPQSENRSFDTYVSTSDEFFKIIESPIVSLQIGEIAQLQNHGVLLKDNTFIQADIIIAATGYKDPEFQFLQPLVKEKVQVYKGFMLKDEPRIGFIGFLDQVVSATAVIPLNFELCFKVMKEGGYRPTRERVDEWIKKTPEDMLTNVKSYVSWLQEEKEHLDRVFQERQNKLLRDLPLKSDKPKVLLFNGQGIQNIGMVTEIYEKSIEVRKLFKRTEELLKFDLYKICHEGPKEVLDRTEICQVAIFVTCIAYLKIAEEKDPEFFSHCKYLLGLSLGEITALVASGALDFDDALKFLYVRGQEMQKSSELSPQGMVNVLNIPREKLLNFIKICQEDGQIYLSNDLTPSRAIVAGDKKSCQLIQKLVEKDGGVAKPLEVSGAFHTPFMTPAAKNLEGYIRQMRIRKPRVPILCNFDGKPMSDPETIRENLIKQIDHPVLFQSALRVCMDQGVNEDCFYEIGPNQKLLRIVRTFVKQAQNDTKISDKFSGA